MSDVTPAIAPTGRGALLPLTGVRFFAAFYVVLFHALPALRTHYHLPLFFATFLANGSLAVGFFFVLSGFILTYTYSAKLRDSTTLWAFWQSRFARIYPVYFLSLLLAWWFQTHLAVVQRLAVLCMVQAWNPFAPDLAGVWNYPAWSLSAEAFFYLAFPFVLPWLSQLTRPSLLSITCFLVAISVFGHTITQVLGNVNHSSGFGRFLPLPLIRLPEFLIGMALGQLFLRSGPAYRPIRVYGAVLATLVLLSLPIGSWVSFVIIPFALLTYDLASGGGPVARLLSTPVMLLLGGASYAIYLLQYPVRAWVRLLFSMAPANLWSLGQILTPIILIFFSIIVFRLWEEPWRRTLRGWFARVGSRSTSNVAERAALD